MTVQVTVVRDVPHPRRGVDGFDALELEADLLTDLLQCTVEATSKHWHQWSVGVNLRNGRPLVVMYKPRHCQSTWVDTEDDPHPGNDADGNTLVSTP